MPKIPDYRSRLGYPIPRDVGAPSPGTVVAPELANAEGVREFTGQLAQQAQGIGRSAQKAIAIADQKISDAQLTSGVAKATAQASVELNNLRNKYLSSPEFNLDPERAKASYDQDLSKIVDQYGSGFSGRAAEVLGGQLSRLAASHSVQFSDDVRRARVGLVRATTLSTLNNLVQAASSAPNDDIAQSNIAQIYGTIAGAVASGAITADHAETLKEQSVRNAIVSRAHLGLISNPEQVLNDISSGNGIWGKIKAGDQANLIEAAQNKIKSNDVDARVQENHNLMMADRQDKAATDSFNNAALDKFVGGKLVPSDLNNIILPSGKPLSYEVRQHWIDNLTKQAAGEEKDDPKVYNDLLRGIYAGSITDVGQLMPYLGKGVSGKTLKNDLIPAMQQASDPIKSKYFNMASAKYRAMFKGDDEMLSMQPDFEMLLDQHIKKDGLKGPDILKKAEELIKPLEEKAWYNFIYRTEGQKTPRFMQELKEPETPKTDPAVQARIDSLKDKMTPGEIADWMKKAGIDPAPYGLQ